MGLRAGWLEGGGGGASVFLVAQGDRKKKVSLCDNGCGVPSPPHVHPPPRDDGSPPPRGEPYTTPDHTACALRAHYVRTACILRTQRLGYSPKNTCHLFTRGKTERCQYHRVGQVSIDTSGCRYNQQHRRRRTVRSWCRLATIEYRRSRAFERR